jgi:hypothetical protein
MVAHKPGILVSGFSVGLIKIPATSAPDKETGWWGIAKQEARRRAC